MEIRDELLFEGEFSSHPIKLPVSHVRPRHENHYILFET